uniref:Tyrosine-protein phosphatase domain-containing protein n=1 Tax=Romanomermis culicivorax TaxID=13658 RepID=A0A915IFN0_ROMCU
MCVPASAELHMYRIYGSKIQSAWLRPRPKLWILQIFCTSTLICLPLILCLFKFWINDGIFYGYTLLSTLFYVYAWLISLILLIIERNYDLPATPGVGHSILLNVFWALAMTADLMYFVNFNGKQWYLILHKPYSEVKNPSIFAPTVSECTGFVAFNRYKNRILLILSVARLFLTLTVFILGMYAPGMITIERRGQFTYRQMDDGDPLSSRYGSTSELESGASSSSLSPPQFQHSLSNSKYSSEFLKSIDSLRIGDQNKILRQDFRKFSSHLSRNLEKFTTNVGRKPENSSRNRYDNVLPYDYNRVLLKWKKNDYINASFLDVKLPRGAKNVRYIATQGPLESTVEDFWAMVFQEKIYIIVMLTDLIESDLHKCCKYWPEGQDKDAAMEIGGLLISCLNVSTPNKQTVIREFSLIHIESHLEMNVVQLQFKVISNGGAENFPFDFRKKRNGWCGEKTLLTRGCKGEGRED